MNNKFVAFDIDGTLFSSENILGPCYQKAIEIFNSNHTKQIKMPLLSDIFNLVGQPSRIIYATLFPELNEEEVVEMCAMVRNFLVQMVSDKKGHYYKGIYEVCKILFEKGFKLIAASNGGYDYVNAVIKTLPAADLFEEIEVLDYKKINSKGNLLKFYLNKYKLEPIDVIMIGDRTSDIEAAFTAKTHFIAAMYGHGSHEEVENSKYFAYSPSEIISLVDKIFNQKKETAK